MDCPECPDLCANATDLAKRECVETYSHKYYESAAMEFDIFCKPGYRDFRPAFVQYVGVLIGNIILGVVADKIGRRKTFLLSLFIGIPALFASGLVNSILAFYLLRMVTGFGIAGSMIVGFAYFSELVSAHQRFKLRTFSNWANARLMLTLVCLFTGEWRLSSYVSAVISLITFAIVWLVLPESHIWLKRMGRFEEAEESRKRLAALAGIPFEPQPLPEETKNSSAPEQKSNIMSVFKDSTLRRNILVLWCAWGVVGCSVYLTDLSGGDMSKNFWVGQFLSSILLSSVRIVLGFADGYLPWMGRRFILLASQGLAIVFFVFVTLFLMLGLKGEWYYTAVYLAAFVFISICWEPCYLCASELMPTDVRATSTASCSIIGRIANILASMLTSLKTVYEPGIHMISIGVGLINLLVAYFFLQETKNCNLEQSGKNVKTEEPANAVEMADLLEKEKHEDEKAK